MADKPEEHPETEAEQASVPDPDSSAAADSGAAADMEGADDADFVADEGVAGTQTGAEAAGQPGTEEDPAVALAAALEQLETVKDQALRAQAEAENARRRATRDVENAHKFALEKFVGELLPVIDSLEKAVESASQAEEAQAAAIAEGVQLSLKMFLDVMTKMGVAQLDPQGEPFDPQQHEAMAMVPNPDLEPNSVMDVMQKGYSLNGRLVRAAMVVVSKAP